MTKTGFKILQYTEKHKESKKLYKYCLIIAAVVVFVVTYILILPGITLEESEKTYWVKLENASQINTTDTYIIAEKSNSYALAVSSSDSNITAVEMSLEEAGTTNDGITYYKIDGKSINNYAYWKNSTANNTNELINTLSDNTNYLKLSTINSTYISDASTTNTKNITYNDTIDGYITISRSSDSIETYYLVYSNNSFLISKDDLTGAEMNIYKQVTITETSEDDEYYPSTLQIQGDTTSTEKWVLITSTSDIEAGETYIIGYYNDSAYTSAGYNSNYMGVDSSDGLIRGDITFTENTDTTTYYTTDTDTSQYRWTFTTDTTGGSLKSLYNNKYLVFGDTASFSDTDPGGLTATYNSTSWLISSDVNGTTYYLKFNDANNSYKFYTASSEYYRALKIYKLYVEESSEDPEEPEDPDDPGDDIPEETPTTTTYWERVTDASEINTTEEYLVIYNDTNSLGYSSGAVAGTVSVTEQGTNNNGKKYYAITGNTDNAYKWKFSTASTTSKLQSVGSSTYYLRLRSSSRIASTSGTSNTFTYQSASETWKISYYSSTSKNTYYLAYSSSAFKSSTTDSYNTMYIYHQVDILVDINISTTWVGTAPSKNTIVNLYVKNDSTNTVSKLLDTSGNQYSLTLTQANNWQGSFEDIPVPNSGTTYLLLQEKVSGYLPSYNNEENYTLGSNLMNFAPISYTNNIANITVTNTAGAELPYTGGPGVKRIYILGTMFLSISLIIQLIKRKYVSS